MEDTLVGFEVAKLAKLKGFDKFNEACETGYHPDTGAVLGKTFWDSFCNDKRSVGRPTQNLLQRWLREEHKIFVRIDLMIEGNEERKNFLELEGFGFWISMLDENNKLIESLESLGYSINYLIYKSYEDALESGLLEALKII